MSDKREPILAQMFAILEGIDEIATAKRNVDQFPAGSRPAANLADGNEQTLLPGGEGSILSFSAPLIVEMLPKIALLVGDTPGTLGPKVNALVATVKRAVLTDAGLQGLVEGQGGGSRGSGRVVYLGLKNSLSHSLSIDADVELEFGIYYRLVPTSL